MDRRKRGVIMSTQQKIKLVCQQCGITARTTARIEIESDGIESRHVVLPDGWLPVWVPDDAKAKLTCGGCLNEVHG